MSETISNVSSTKQAKWIRGVYMALFVVCGALAITIAMCIAVYQFLATVMTGTRNENLLKLNQGLSKYCYQLLLYLTYNTDNKPYPFNAWPDNGNAEKVVVSDSA
jgi:hypothetical protein